MAHLDYRKNELQVGDFAKSIESGWTGQIKGFETQGGDIMARMMGADPMGFLVCGMTLEQSLSPDDIQWFAPEDLVRVGP